LNPATVPAPAEAIPPTAEEAETFLRSYYRAVSAGDYQTSWSRLAPEFQRSKARSYEYYVGFWNDNDVEVGDVKLIDATSEQVILDVRLRWNAENNFVTDRFTLRRGQHGELLIAGQTTVAPD
jgi:hypothetical protein